MIIKGGVQLLAAYMLEFSYGGPWLCRPVVLFSLNQ